MTAKKTTIQNRGNSRKESEYGPQDHADNFIVGRKRKSDDATSPDDNNVVHPNTHTEIVGKKQEGQEGKKSGMKELYLNK